MLLQLPAAVVHPSFLENLGSATTFPAILHIGDRKSSVWIVPAVGKLLQVVESASEETVWLDSRTATSVGLRPDQDVSCNLEFDLGRLVIQPARIDDPIATTEAIVAPPILDRFATRGSYALVRSSSRTMAVRLRSPRKPLEQSIEKLRLNFHARLLLGLQNDAMDNRPSVEICALPENPEGRLGASRFRRFLHLCGQLFRRLLEILGDAFLRAPSVALAVRSSASADDSMGVVRCSASTLDLLGVEPGDDVRVRWAGRHVLARVYLLDTSDLINVGAVEIVNWTQADQVSVLPNEATASIPSAIRAELGLPRDGVVEVRRSILGVLKKRAVGLSLPLVGVAVSVPQLGLDLWLGALILAACSVLTLAGDRIPNRESTTRREWRRMFYGRS